MTNNIITEFDTDIQTFIYTEESVIVQSDDTINVFNTVEIGPQGIPGVVGPAGEKGDPGEPLYISAIASEDIGGHRVVLIFNNQATYANNINNYNGQLAITNSATYYGARGSAIGAGAFTIPSWGHRPTKQSDGERLSRQSYIWSFRGGSTTLDRFDIAGGTTGAWSNAFTYNAQLTNFSTGTGADYAPVDQEGRWGYIVQNNSNLMFRFDVKNIAMYPWTSLPLQSGTAAVGNRVAVVPYVDSTGTNKVSVVFVQSHLSTAMFRCEVII